MIAMHSSNHKHDRGAADSDALPSGPSLPFELVEAILLHVPLRFPLSTLTGRDDAIHETCAAAFAAISLPNSYLDVFVPRFCNGAIKLCTNERFDMTLIHRLYSHGLKIADRSHFAAAFLHNRVDFLDWWAFTAKLPPASPKWHRGDLSLAQQALKCKAWNSLEWLARTAFLANDDLGLRERDLCALVEHGGEQEIKLVETWLRSKVEVRHYPWNVAVSACGAGCLSVLDALREARRESMEDDINWTIPWSCYEAAKGGHTHVLDWLLNTIGWPLPYIPELACEHGQLDVLRWYEANKHRIDPTDDWMNNLPYDDHGDPFLDLDESAFCTLEFCLDQASIQGRLDILDWLLEHGPVVPHLYTRLAMDGASGGGHVAVLQWWNSRATSKGLTLRYSDQSLLLATRNNHYPVLEWWVKESGLELRYDVNDLLQQALCSKDPQGCVGWWLH